MSEIRATSSDRLRRFPLAAIAFVCVALVLGFLPSGAAVNPREIFSDVTDPAGITWKQFSGESPDRFMIEAAGGGVAFLDYDGDGLLDIFLVNGGETPKGKSPGPVKNALYRNLGNGKFEDVAAKAGVDRLPFYGMGVAVGDYDMTATRISTSPERRGPRSTTITVTARLQILRKKPV